jgi:hypothetical protein
MHNLSDYSVRRDAELYILAHKGEKKCVCLQQTESQHVKKAESHLQPAKALTIM